MFLLARVHLTTLSICDATAPSPNLCVGWVCAPQRRRRLCTSLAPRTTPSLSTPGLAPRLRHATARLMTTTISMRRRGLFVSVWNLPSSLPLRGMCAAAVCVLGVSHAFHIHSMAACMNVDRAELEMILLKLNSRLPAADTVCIALVNGYVGPASQQVVLD